MRSLAQAAAVALVACSSTSKPSGGRCGPPIEGTFADVHTVAGEHNGWKTRVCANEGVEVTGTGSRIFEWATEENMKRTSVGPEGERFRKEAEGTISAGKWRGDGFGVSCGRMPGPAFQLYTGDWRQVDAMVERAGAFLARHDYKGIITISVMGPICLE